MNTTSDKCHERPNSLSYPYIDQDTVKNRKSDNFRQKKRKIKCHKKDQRMHSSKVTQDLKPEENAFKCDTISKLTPSIGLRHKNSELNKYVAENFIVTLIKKDDGFGFGFDGGVPGQLEIKVTSLVPGGIADLSGQIRIGDCIATVDGHNVIGESHFSVFEYLQRESNKVVTFCIKRIIHNGKLRSTCSRMHNLDLYQGSTEIMDEKQPSNYHNKKQQVDEKNDKYLDRRQTLQEQNNFNHCENHSTDFRSGIRKEICNRKDHTILYPSAEHKLKQQEHARACDKNKIELYQSGVQDFNVTLCNNDEGYGFGFNGGCLNQPEITITHIKRGGKANLSGQMQIGDCILSINNHRMMGKSHQYVLCFLENREGDTTTFGIRRLVHNVSKSSQPALKLCKQELSFKSCNNIFLGGSHDHSSISQSDSLILNNLTETTKSTLGQHCDKQTFYQTTGFHVALRKLFSYQKVIITGGHGCGKTSLGMELLNYFSKTESEMFTKKNPFIIRVPNHWHVTVEPGQNVIILLDDIFGKVKLDEHSFSKWSCIFPDMHTCINDSRMCVFVIIIVRDNVLSTISERIQRTELFQNANNCTVNLNIESSVSIDDRREILRRHFQFPSIRQIFVLCINHEMCPDERNSIHISPGEIESIISIPKLFAYPLCCYNYVNNETYLQRGPRFFIQPYEIMYNDIKHICEDDKLAYFLFCLILLSKSNEFLRKNTADNYFGLSSKLYNTLLEICNKPGFDSSLTIQLKHKISIFSGIYVQVLNNGSVVRLSNQTTLETMVRILSHQHLDLLIYNLDLELLNSVLTMNINDSKDQKIYIPTQFYESVIDRFICEILNGEQMHVARSNAFNHQPFVEAFVNSMNNETYGLCFTKNKDNKCLLDHASKTDPPRYALISKVLSRDQSLNETQDQYFNEIIYKGFCYACRKSDIRLFHDFGNYVRYLPDQFLLNGAINFSDTIFNLLLRLPMWTPDLKRSALICRQKNVTT